MSVDPIVVVAFPGISPFHLAVPGMVFGEDRRDDGVPLFDVRVCGATPGEIVTTGGFSVRPRYRLDALADAATIIVPGWRDPRERPPASLLIALRAARGTMPRQLCPGSRRGPRWTAGDHPLAMGRGTGARLPTHRRAPT